MKIRLEGTEQEIKEFVNQLKINNFVVSKYSKFYPNEVVATSRFLQPSGRMYIEGEFRSRVGPLGAKVG